MTKRNVITIEVHTLNHGKHLDALTKKGVSIYDIEREKFALKIKVSQKDLDKTLSYFKDLGLAPEYVGSGRKSVFKKVLKRLPLFISVAIFAIGLAVLSNFVFFVKISGNSKVESGWILERIRESGVSFPVLKKELDTKFIKNTVTEMDGVALTSVVVKGCFLYIDVNEELDKEEIIPQDECAIVAQNDCIITKIVVERGTALVKVGDSVKKGQTLIAPYFVLNEEGERLPCSAMGWAEGRVFRSQETSYAEKRFEAVETGESKEIRELWFGDIPLIKGDESPFAECSVETQTFTTYPLPVKIVVKRYKEKQVKEVYKPISDVKEQIEQDLYTKIYIECKNNMQILDKWCIIKNNAGYYSIKCTVETLEKVSIKAYE